MTEQNNKLRVLSFFTSRPEKVTRLIPYADIELRMLIGEEIILPPGMRGKITTALKSLSIVWSYLSPSTRRKFEQGIREYDPINNLKSISKIH